MLLRINVLNPLSHTCVVFEMVRKERSGLDTNARFLRGNNLPALCDVTSDIVGLALPLEEV